MNDLGQHIPLVGVVVIAVIIGIALPLQTLRRLRTREQRRDEQLATNAQPWLTRISHGLAALIGLSGMLGSAVGATTGHPFFWAGVVLGAGIVVATIISASVVFRPPPEPE